MEASFTNLILSEVVSTSFCPMDNTTFVNEASIRQKKLIFGDANMPLGYKSGIVDGRKCMIKDPDAEHMVEDFFQYFKKHQSKQGAIRYMQSTYGIDFSYSMLRTMLSSEFYKGTYRGFPYCPAYLTESEWNEIQTISVRNVKRTPSGRVYLFSSLMHCPVCGQKLVGTGCSSIINRKTGEKRTYCYYRCNRAITDCICTNRHRVSQNLIEKYLLENLTDEYHRYKIRNNKINEENRKKKVDRSPEQIRKELERLNLLFQKGRISFDYYDEEYTRLEQELSTINVTPSEPDRDLSYLDELLQTDFREMYNSLTLENRRAFWRSTIKEIHLNDDYTVKEVDFL